MVRSTFYKIVYLGIERPIMDALGFIQRAAFVSEYAYVGDPGYKVVRFFDDGSVELEVNDFDMRRDILRGRKLYYDIDRRLYGSNYTMRNGNVHLTEEK